jgi:uncharacterized protein
MQFNVSQLLKSTPGEERRYSFNEWDRRYAELEGEVHGDVRLMRTDRGILVMGEVDTAIGCECSRCLKEFTLPVAFELEEEFFPSIDVNTGVPLELPEDRSLVIDSHHILDLGETVRQYALIQAPLKPLCRLDCAGICPICGKDRNRSRCTHPAREKDHRWEKLAGLRVLK